VKTKTGKSFGTYLRQRRVDEGFGLREFAGLVGISPSYLSQIEQEQVDPPANEHITIIAQKLSEDRSEMMALAGRLSDELHEVVVRQPAEIRELLLAAKRLTPEQVSGFAKEMRKRSK